MRPSASLAQAALDSAITAHHQCLANAGNGEGPETAVQAVIGHGGGGRKDGKVTRPVKCGDWGMPFENPVELDRQPFIQNNYQAVKIVVGWQTSSSIRSHPQGDGRDSI